MDKAEIRKAEPLDAARLAIRQVGDDLLTAISAVTHVRDIAGDEWKQDAAVEVLALKRSIQALGELL